MIGILDALLPWYFTTWSIPVEPTLIYQYYMYDEGLPMEAWFENLLSMDKFENLCEMIRALIFHL